MVPHGKKSPKKIPKNSKVFIKEKILSSFDEYESILPKGICEKCRSPLRDILEKGDESNRKLPENNYEEMVELLKNRPPSSATRNGVCNCDCFCCEKSKSKVSDKATPKKESGGIVKKKTIVLPESRPDRVKTVFGSLSPKTRAMLALEIHSVSVLSNPQ